MENPCVMCGKDSETIKKLNAAEAEVKRLVEENGRLKSEIEANKKKADEDENIFD